MKQTIDSFLTWLVEEKGSAANTIAAYRNDLGQFLEFLNAATAVETWAGVTEGDIRAYLDELQDRAYASSTVARKIAAVRSFFHYLVLTGILDDDPTVQVTASAPARPSFDLLPRQVVQQFWDRVPDSTPTGLRDRAMVALIAAPGLEPSQVVALDLEDVELPGARTVQVRSRRGKVETVSLPPAAAADLARYMVEGRPTLAKGETHALFVNVQGRRLSRQGLWLALKKRGKAAGLEHKVSPRVLRGVLGSEQAR